jgi:hypothetical protein
VRCLNCGTENPPGGRFCIACAQPLPAVSAAPTPGPPPPVTAARTFKAGFAALAGFLAMVTLGVLLWFLVLKPDAESCPAGTPCTLAGPATSPPPTGVPATTPPTPLPTTPVATTPPPTSPATTTPPPPTTPPPSPSPTPPPKPKGPKVQLKVCDRVTDVGDCIGPGMTKSQDAPFAVWIGTTGATKGDKLTWMLIIPDTGQPGSKIYEHVLSGANNINITDSTPLHYTFRGEFRVWYNGNMVKFKKTPILVIK